MFEKQFMWSPLKGSALLLLAFLILISPGLVPTSAKAQDKFPDIPYVLVDTSNNAVLAENRMDERWHPASLTKLMTAYVTFRAIKFGEISAGSPVTMTAKATKTPPSKMGYKKGTQLRFDMALRILLVKSANDVAVAVAESLAGSVDAFATRMNLEAKRLGLENTHYTNPNGLQSPGQFVSARDMVILSSAIWNEFPQYRSIFETPTIQVGKKKYTSYNLLLERFDGTTGMKTGFICAAGYNIVASVERKGRHLVAVILGANSQTQRAELAARLFLKGFDMPSGKPMQDYALPQTPIGPKNMRKVMCSKKAREGRYDPASETAVLKSPFLHKRRITKQPVQITLGGIDGEASPAWLARAFTPTHVPIPVKRPDYVVVDVDGKKIGSSSFRGTFPIPMKNPRTSATVQ